LPYGLVLAMRAGIGAIVIYDSDAQTEELQRLGPRPYRLRGGGPYSVRGVQAGALGMRNVEANGFPGGTRSWIASLELRVPLGDSFGIGTFLDAGDVDGGSSEQKAQFRFDHPNTTLGAGIRYKTIVGPLRLDVGWLVRGLELAILGAARYGDTVTVTTRIAGFRRMWARRFSEVLAADGSTVATAWTDWVLLSTAGQPIRIPAEMQALVSASSPFTPTRVDAGEPPPEATTLRSVVRPADVDPMGHVNNAAYLDIIDEVIAARAGGGLTAPTTVALEYLRPALPGMTLDVTAWAADAGTACRLREAGASADLLRARVG